MFFAALLVASSTSAHAGVLEAGVFAARPSVLSVGQLFGPSVRAEYSFSAWSLGASFELGLVDENDPTYVVAHTESRLFAHAAWGEQLGAGHLSIGTGIGGVLLRETRTRHQAERLRIAGIDPDESGWAVGVAGALELALRLALYDRWCLVTRAGPNLAYVEELRFGWSLGLGIAWTFEGEEE